jgi:hypothetical protein
MEWRQFWLGGRELGEAQRGAEVGRQFLGGGESRDVAHLKRDQDCEDEPHAGHGHEELNLRGHLEHGAHPLLEPAHALPDEHHPGPREVALVA